MINFEVTMENLTHFFSIQSLSLRSYLFSAGFERPNSPHY